jgi:hypothetical protein
MLKFLDELAECSSQCIMKTCGKVWNKSSEYGVAKSMEKVV